MGRVWRYYLGTRAEHSNPLDWWILEQLVIRHWNINKTFERRNTKFGLVYWLFLRLSIRCFSHELSLLLFYVTCDDNFSHICAGALKKLKLYLRSGSQRHRHFAGFFNVPVPHRHGTNLFIRWFRHTAPLVAFYNTLRIILRILDFNPSVPSGGGGMFQSWIYKTAHGAKGVKGEYLVYAERCSLIT